MSSNKQIAKNLILNVGVFFINLGINFFLSPYIIRTLGREMYGFSTLITSLVGYTSIITTAFGSMAGRFITQAYYKGYKEKADGYCNSVFFANWILSLIFSVVFLFLVVYLDKVLTIPSESVSTVRWMLILTVINALIALNSGLFGIGTYIKNRVDISSVQNLFTYVLYALCVVILFWAFKPNILYLCFATLLSGTVNAGINIRLKKKLIPELHYSPLQKYDWKKIWRLFSSGLWNSVNQLSNLLLNQLDLLIANVFIGAAAMGDYAVVKIFPNLIYSLLGTLSGTFTPHFNILYAKEKRGELTIEIKKAMKIVAYLICIPLGFLIVFGQDFFALWVPSMDARYLYLLSVITLVPMIIGASINPIFGVFTITNKLRIPSLVLFVFGVANTVGVLILVKTTNLGLWSIPIVGGILHAFRNFFFSPSYAAKVLNLPLLTFYPTVFRGCLSLGVVVLMGLFLHRILPLGNWYYLIGTGILLTLLSLGVNLFLFFNREERKSLRAFVTNIAGKFK